MIALLKHADRIMMNANMYEANVSFFRVLLHNEYYLWSSNIEAAPDFQELVAGSNIENMEEKIDRRAREVIIVALGDNPFSAIQDCSSTKYRWEKGQACYAGKSTSNKLSVLPALIKLQIGNGTSRETTSPWCKGNYLGRSLWNLVLLSRWRWLWLYRLCRTGSNIVRW